MLRRIITRIYNELERSCVPGTTTKDLNDIAERIFNEFPYVVPGPSLYNFPGVICTSVNLVAAHGVPSRHTVLRKGDVIKIDISAGFKDSSAPHGSSGFIDSCRTFCVGNVRPSIKALVRASEEVTRLACSHVSPGMTTGQLGAYIEQLILDRGFRVLPDLMGHGVGDHLHMAPNLPCFAFDGGEIIEEGMTLAIEPVLTLGHSSAIIKMPDGWSILGSGVSAQTEHTVLVSKNGNKIII